MTSEPTWLVRYIQRRAPPPRVYLLPHPAFRVEPARQPRAPPRQARVSKSCNIKGVTLRCQTALFVVRIVSPSPPAGRVHQFQHDGRPHRSSAGGSRLSRRVEYRSATGYHERRWSRLRVPWRPAVLGNHQELKFPSAYSNSCTSARFRMDSAHSYQSCGASLLPGLVPQARADGRNQDAD